MEIESIQEQFIDELYNFIISNFNDFEHRKKEGEKNWWFNNKYGAEKGKRGKSWSPFVEACFILLGEKLNKDHNANYKIGHDYTHSNISNFMADINHPYGINGYPKYPRRCFDVSWANENGELILALEHEESGNYWDEQLENILDELDKLRYFKGKSKLIITRPHPRIRNGETYPEIIEKLERKIKEKILEIKPLEEENWILIMISPESNLKNPQDETKMIFYCYKWNQTDFIKSEKSFKIKMNDIGIVEKITANSTST